MTTPVEAPPAHRAGADAHPTHRPALDGIRMVAVVSVLLYHGLVGWSRGGFLGVDVFFVLSGYLITTLLVDEWQRWGSIDLVAFYRRRARRLLPALVLVVVAVAVWAWRVAEPTRLGSIRGDGIASLLYVANWRFVIVKTSYFDQYSDPSPFRHMWSLAIEEQYYVLFPLVVMGLLALSRRRRWLLPAVLAVVAAASAVEMAVLFDPTTDPSRVYFGTDTRIHELMIGSLLAVLMVRARELPGVLARLARLAPYAAVAALLLLLAAFNRLTDQSAFLYRGGFALVCVVTAVLVASVELAPTGPVGRVLSLGPVVWIGKVSYGLYLWHWPIFVAISPQHFPALHDTSLLLTRLGVTVVVATASYYLVEHPIRSGALRRLPRHAGRAVAAVALPLALVATLVATAAAVPPPLEETSLGGGQVTSGKPTLLVVGDAVGLNLALGFPKDRFSSWQLRSDVSSGCGVGPQQLSFDGRPGPAVAACSDTLGSWGRTVQQERPAAVVLSLGLWDVIDHVVGGGTLQVGTPAYADHLTAELNAAHTALTATGAHLYVPNVPCYDEHGTGEPQIAAARNDPKRVAAVNAVLRDFGTAHADDTTIVDVASWLCPGGQERARFHGTTVRTDGVHLTQAGAALLWSKVLMPAIQPAATQNVHVLTVGDSVPYGLAAHYPAAEHPGLTVQDTTALGCGLLPEHAAVDGQEQPNDADCRTWADQTMPYAVAHADANVGMVFAGIGDEFDRIVDGHILTFGSPEHTAWLTQQLESRIQLFRERGVPVLVPTVPCHQVPDFGTSKTPSIINDESRIDALNGLLGDVVDHYTGQPGPRVELVDLHGYLCPDGYTNTVDGITLREDGLHFTPDGAAYVWKFLAPKVEAIAAESRKKG